MAQNHPEQTSELTDQALQLALAQLMSPERVPPINDQTRSTLQRHVERQSGAQPRPVAAPPPFNLPTDVPQELPHSVQTLVFFDTEATGLRDGGSGPRITELALVAMSATAFRQFERTLRSSPHPNHVRPRVLNRLNLCFHPGRPIPPRVSDLTGLDNEGLEHEPRFSAQTVALLRAFLDPLPPPICLLAHNAHAYDVPLLGAEIRKALSDTQPLDFDYLVLDTLHALRKICSAQSRPPPVPSPDHESSDDDLGVQPIVYSDSEHELHIDPDDISDRDLLEASVATHRETWEGVQTPSLTTTPSKGFSTPLTPPTSSAKRPTQNHRVKPTPLPFVGIPDTMYDHIDVTPDKESGVRRGHHPPPPAPKRRKKLAAADPGCSGVNRAKKRLDFNQPPSFKLPQLHEHFLGALPAESHGAESDCLSLLRVCATQASDILDLIPSDAKSFASVKPMW